ncbi:hypothetical protein I3760_05G100700 [Carya illinoinensis]|nr:hypothetical protein I3760_05G100700 [Carya illinoinensis]
MWCLAPLGLVFLKKCLLLLYQWSSRAFNLLLLHEFPIKFQVSNLLGWFVSAVFSFFFSFLRAGYLTQCISQFFQFCPIYVLFMPCMQANCDCVHMYMRVFVSIKFFLLPSTKTVTTRYTNFIDCWIMKMKIQ